MPARSRPARALGLLALAAAALAGCSAQSPGLGIACPAIAYGSTLRVAVEGDAAHVNLCVGDDCTPASKEALAMVDGTSDGDTWTFSGQFPEEFTIRALDADRQVLADIPAEVEWVRTGGSEECGGPLEASITIRL